LILSSSEKSTRPLPPKSGAASNYRELQDVISLLGIEELGAEGRRIVERARRLQRFLTQPFAVTEAFSGVPGRSVAVADTIAGCKAILAGECDEWQESSLYMIGTLDEGRDKEKGSRTAADRQPERTKQAAAAK
jgi:F-type H+-transporting ATPase subunit beta